MAYKALLHGDRQANLIKAIACYRAALLVYAHDNRQAEWSIAQMNLGDAYFSMPGTDHLTYLYRAIDSYQEACMLQTCEENPSIWATTQRKLGDTYLEIEAAIQAETASGIMSEINSTKQQKALEKAIAYYKAALQVCTIMATPLEWAALQFGLGDAYHRLAAGNRECNQIDAIAHYQAALHVYTISTFPLEWAAGQNNCGNAYFELAHTAVSAEQREQKLTQAIACYEEAYKVFIEQQRELQAQGASVLAVD